MIDCLSLVGLAISTYIIMEEGPSEPKPKQSTKGKQSLLFGKIFTQIPYIALMLLSSLDEVWFWSSVITVKIIEIQNVFEIEFSKTSDMRYAINRALWEIDTSLFILQSWELEKTLKEMFKYENFWVQVWHLAPQLVNNENTLNIANDFFAGIV